MGKRSNIKKLSKNIGPKEIEMIGVGLQILNENRDKVGELLEFLDCKMPNIKMKTMAGKVLWDDLKAGRSCLAVHPPATSGRG